MFKLEKSDLNETRLKLNKVSYDKKERRIDDYEPKYTLQLNGAGKVRISEERFEPLPNSLFVIPLEDNTHYYFDNSRFTIKNDRGTYAIEIISESDE